MFISYLEYYRPKNLKILFCLNPSIIEGKNTVFPEKICKPLQPLNNRGFAENHRKITENSGKYQKNNIR